MRMNVHSHYELESRPDHGKYKMTISLLALQGISLPSLAALFGAAQNDIGISEGTFARLALQKQSANRLVSGGP